jgi:hypothetical protein
VRLPCFALLLSIATAVGVTICTTPALAGDDELAELREELRSANQAYRTLESLLGADNSTPFPLTFRASRLGGGSYVANHEVEIRRYLAWLLTCGQPGQQRHLLRYGLERHSIVVILRGGVLNLPRLRAEIAPQYFRDDRHNIFEALLSIRTTINQRAGSLGYRVAGEFPNAELQPQSSTRRAPGTDGPGLLGVQDGEDSL